MGIVDGKVTVITGAGGGIGREHALLFARQGAKVVINDLGGARDGTGQGNSMAEKVVAETKEAGGDAVANFDDISERSGVESLLKTAIDAFGRVDVWINNAGILRDKSLLKMDDKMWDLVVKVHLRGSFLCTQAAGQHMRDAGNGGRIINTSSVSGLLGNFGQSNYAAAKAGIYGLTRTASIEFEKYKITVNALAPVAYTRMTEDLSMMQAVPNAQHLLSPSAISPAALYLASDAAAHITGTVVAVEGPRMYLYKMIQTEAAVAKDGKQWTAQEIGERWSEIAG